MFKLDVPLGALRPTVIFNVLCTEEPVVVVTGLGLKLALVFFGSPLTLRLTVLDAPTAPNDTLKLTLDPRTAVFEAGDAVMLKSGATTRFKVVEWVSPPLVPVTVTG